MIVNVNQCASMFDETLHVFKFSAVAKQVSYIDEIRHMYTVSITSLTPPHFCACHKFRMWISNVICHGLLFCTVSSVKMRGDYSFC